MKQLHQNEHSIPAAVNLSSHQGPRLLCLSAIDSRRGRVCCQFLTFSLPTLQQEFEAEQDYIKTLSYLTEADRQKHQERQSVSWMYQKPPGVDAIKPSSTQVGRSPPLRKVLGASMACGTVSQQNQAHAMARVPVGSTCASPGWQQAIGNVVLQAFRCEQHLGCCLSLLEI